MGLRGPTLAAALLCACSFSSFSEGRGSAGLGPDEEDDDEPPEVEDPKGGSTSDGVADGGAGGDEGPPMTTGMPDPTLPPPPGDEGGYGTDGHGEGSTGTGSDVDPCEDTSTFELAADEGTLTEPMVVVDVSGLGPAAYSPTADAGDISFTIDVQCPGTYFLHARVADAWAGVHSCCDPDSYDVQWPGGSGSWFYGCQTTTEGWHWLPVTNGVQGASCDDVEMVSFDLAVGEHTITFHNRESLYWEWDTVAALANVVITDDPAFTGP